MEIVAYQIDETIPKIEEVSISDMQILNDFIRASEQVGSYFGYGILIFYFSPCGNLTRVDAAISPVNIGDRKRIYSLDNCELYHQYMREILNVDILEEFEIMFENFLHDRNQVQNWIVNMIEEYKDDCKEEKHRCYKYINEKIVEFGEMKNPTDCVFIAHHTQLLNDYVRNVWCSDKE